MWSTAFSKTRGDKTTASFQTRLFKDLQDAYEDEVNRINPGKEYKALAKSASNSNASAYFPRVQTALSYKDVGRIWNVFLGCVAGKFF